jgi:hypothetical protein
VAPLGTYPKTGFWPRIEAASNRFPDKFLRVPNRHQSKLPPRVILSEAKDLSRRAEMLSAAKHDSAVAYCRALARREAFPDGHPSLREGTASHAVDGSGAGLGRLRSRVAGGHGAAYLDLDGHGLSHQCAAEEACGLVSRLRTAKGRRPTQAHSRLRLMPIWHPLRLPCPSLSCLTLPPPNPPAPAKNNPQDTQNEQENPDHHAPLYRTRVKYRR